jgi:AcrR family transcriptional regulator
MQEPRYDVEQSRREPTAAMASLERAVLEESAVNSYPGMTVQAILDRAGVSRKTFYRLYRDKGDCFATAYSRAADAFADRVLAGCRTAPNWQTGVDLALRELTDFATEEPLLLGGILAQVPLAEGVTAKKRTELGKRFAAAVDAARRQSEAGNAPPAIAGAFVVGAIEAALRSALGRATPEEFSDAIPALRYIAVATFLGADEARRSDE